MKRLVLALLLLSTPAHAFPARVVSCHDGDTCKAITASGDRITLRLHVADTPETPPCFDPQPYSAQATAFTRRMIVGKVVDVRPVGRSWKRSVADITVQGQDVSKALIKAGLAWADIRHTNDPAYLAAQIDAQHDERGLWGDPAVSPWDWRLTHNLCRRGSAPR
ncbi:thermonuclease family protein [Roseicella sp. DB1501]|uniref:thermonuclease family protein n=1 Tax=Roseicella sp. DB1501 TaxID=2730925 RepID=UPI001492A137|nr:thermonuclease family protein [Roseicella sp. DB1501]NOG73716.1 thermonuclease family protein [Roseicella sp. DB1501]